MLQPILIVLCAYLLGAISLWGWASCTRIYKHACLKRIKRNIMSNPTQGYEHSEYPGFLFVEQGPFKIKYRISYKLKTDEPIVDRISVKERLSETERAFCELGDFCDYWILFLYRRFRVGETIHRLTRSHSPSHSSKHRY